MFDEGRALDFKVFLRSLSLSFFPPRRHFNMSHINTKDGVGGDRPTFAPWRRVIAPPLDSAVCFPSLEMIGADKKNL